MAIVSSKKISKPRENKKPEIFVSDINEFFCKNSGRENNDKNNKKRENVLANVIDMPSTHPYLQDSTWGSQWCEIQDKFTRLLNDKAYNENPKICFDKIDITHKGGRRYNFDLKVDFTKDSTSVYKIPKLEFKNCKSFEHLPQFLSLSTESPIQPFVNCESYADFYYHNYLPSIVELYEPYTFELPSLKVYKKLVQRTDSKVLPIFNEMKTREKDIDKKTMSQIVDRSGHEYLKIFGKKEFFNIVALDKKIQTSQAGKTFVFWDGDTFKEEPIDLERLKLTGINHLKVNKNGLYNSIVCDTKTGDYVNFLLRWKNHKGIQNPALQISFTSAKSKLEE